MAAAMWCAMETLCSVPWRPHRRIPAPPCALGGASALPSSLLRVARPTVDPSTLRHAAVAAGGRGSAAGLLCSSSAAGVRRTVGPRPASRMGKGFFSTFFCSNSNPSDAASLGLYRPPSSLARSLLTVPRVSFRSNRDLVLSSRGQRRRPRLKQACAVGAAGYGASAARAGASRTEAKAGPAPAAGGGRLVGREASTARPGALCDRRQPPRFRQGSAPVSSDLRLRAPAPLRRHNQVVCCVPLPVRAARLDCQDYKDNIKIVAIDLADRPAWYKEKVDPENKDPAKKQFAEALLAFTDAFNIAILIYSKEDVSDETVAALDKIEEAQGEYNDGPFLLGHFSLVDVAYVPFIGRFQIFFQNIKNYDITKGRPNLQKFIEAQGSMAQNGSCSHSLEFAPL
ncbi:hypothetical protein PVAP13_3NG157200 [Panicum virgatum]|uniref:Uncharacterized protein n=1 Tax=Panicum virgatum TaxID=38727 RepID=A0A8T0UH52_PANVG|nr:hypothetical protein PVAP13_3NG157200 [Panicum virgatum]